MKSKLNEVQDNYLSVLKLVEDGLNISEAINKFSFTSPTFYRNITELQKQKLYRVKKLNTKCGVGFQRNYISLEKHFNNKQIKTNKNKQK
tara:strand:- start:380 stop:649 length:270 start_codon:yes stop_codon:yes gene_type:complete